MNYDSTKALAAQIFYLRNSAEEASPGSGYFPVNFPVKWPTEVQGAHLLGAGCYGAAYELPDGRVLKLGKGIDGTSVWISEAAKHFAATGKPMRHAPKVWAFDTIEYAEKTAKQVFITAEPSREAYVCRCISGHGYCELPSKWIRVADTTQVGWWAVMEKVESERKRAEAAYEDWGYLPAVIRHQVMRWAEDRRNQFGEYLNDDMHGGNWGRSVETRRIVVFDPFSGNCKPTLTSTYIDPVQASLKRKEVPPHRMIQHAGPTKGRWARG